MDFGAEVVGQEHGKKGHSHEEEKDALVGHEVAEEELVQRNSQVGHEHRKPLVRRKLCRHLQSKYLDEPRTDDCDHSSVVEPDHEVHESDVPPLAAKKPHYLGGEVNETDQQKSCLEAFAVCHESPEESSDHACDCEDDCAGGEVGVVVDDGHEDDFHEESQVDQIEGHQVGDAEQNKKLFVP